MKHNDTLIEKNVLAVLKRYYGLKVESLQFLPVGEESFAYLATDDNNRQYFAKYCNIERILNQIDKVNNLLLQISYLDFIVPPIQVKGQTSFNVLNGKVYVYPYIKGKVTEKENHKLDEGLINSLLEITAKIHLVSPATVDLPREKFENNYAEMLDSFIEADKMGKFDQTVSQLLADSKETIRQLIKTQNEVALKYKTLKPDLVLTHGDITGINAIVTENGQIKLTDWDEAMLAPFEKDINFFFDNPNFSLEKYLKLTGKKEFNLELKEYYNRQWALDCILEDFDNILKKSKNNLNQVELIKDIKQYLSYYQKC